MSSKKSTFWLQHNMKHEEAFVHSIKRIPPRFIIIFFSDQVLAPAQVAGLTCVLKLCGSLSGNIQVITQTLPRIPYYRPTVRLIYDCPLRYAISGYTKSRAFVLTTRRKKKHLERCHENLLIKYHMGKV